MCEGSESIRITISIEMSMPALVNVVVSSSSNHHRFVFLGALLRFKQNIRLESSVLPLFYLLLNLVSAE